MFRKLLKYDMKYVWNVWRIMAVSLFGLSVVGSFVLRYILEHFEKMEHSFSLAAMFMLFFAAAYLSIFAAAIITTVFVYLRFYKNFFTDEGYLTFTLPASRGTLLRAKTANALIWEGLFYLLLIVCAIPFAIISPPSQSGELINLVVFETLGDAINQVWGEIGAWSLVYVIEFILFIVFSLFYSVAIMQLCITIGAMLVKKAKALLGIGIYYGFSMVTSFIFQICYLAFIWVFIDGFGNLLAGSSETVICAFVALLLLVVCLIMATFALIVHSITQICLEKRLNLA
ncbi:MAG: hypothetical protein IJN48_04885 [Clostridia bacterium]|nr:hypothetical protein [Clostridia bacterium]